MVLDAPTLIKTEWQTAPGLVEYETALAAMEARVQAIFEGRESELVWLLEHPPLYTAGTSAKPEDLIDGARFPVFQTGRGGQFTYHGPGQRVAYVMLDLRRRGQDVRKLVCNLEDWLIASLAEFDVKGERRPGRIGIWVKKGPSEAKIAAVGIRLRRWISYHGISLNVAPDLSHYAGIVPCGISEYGVTSLADLGVNASMTQVNSALQTSFEQIFG